MTRAKFMPSRYEWRMRTPLGSLQHAERVLDVFSLTGRVYSLQRAALQSAGCGKGQTEG